MSTLGTALLLGSVVVRPAQPQPLPPPPPPVTIASGAPALAYDPGRDDPGEIRRKCAYNERVIDNMRDHTLATLRDDRNVQSKVDQLLPAACEEWKRQWCAGRKATPLVDPCKLPVPICDRSAVAETLFARAAWLAYPEVKADLDARYEAHREDCAKFEAMADARILQENEQRRHELRKEQMEDEMAREQAAWEEALEKRKEEKDARDRLAQSVQAGQEKADALDQLLAASTAPQLRGPFLDPGSKRPTPTWTAPAPRRAQELNPPDCREATAAGRKLKSARAEVLVRLVEAAEGTPQRAKLELLRDALDAGLEDLERTNPNCVQGR